MCLDVEAWEKGISPSLCPLIIQWGAHESVKDTVLTLTISSFSTSSELCNGNAAGTVYLNVLILPSQLTYFVDPAAAFLSEN